MLIYEKNNKLNINFDNEVSEQPDLQISKEDGKTQVLVDGQESGGGSSVELVKFTVLLPGNDVGCDHTPEQIREAASSGKIIIAQDNSNRLCWMMVREDTISAKFDIVNSSPNGSTYVGNTYFTYEDGIWSYTKRGSTITSE
jgi:hypothetical protein